MDIYPPAAQRPPLLKFAKAIGARGSAIRRDECGDWRINGSHGHIFAIPGSLDDPKCPGFQFLVMDWTAKGWSNAKRALSFARVTKDGDDEGALFLNRLPTTDEASAIRHYVGIAKKRDMGEDEVTRRREWAKAQNSSAA